MKKEEKPDIESIVLFIVFSALFAFIIIHLTINFFAHLPIGF